VKLAQEMGLHTSAMVLLIDDLERRAWVVRQKSESDRRRYQLIVTSGGAKALKRLTAVLQEVESRGLETLSPNELKVMTSALDKLYRAYRD
jgi:DNA-binding MarR family transcriptional regulator